MVSVPAAPLAKCGEQPILRLVGQAVGWDFAEGPSPLHVATIGTRLTVARGALVPVAAGWHDVRRTGLSPGWKVLGSMAQFEARTATEAGRAVVALAGDCDLEVRDELTSVLLAAVGSALTVFVDLTEVRFLDSSGLHALIAGHHAAVERGGRLCVVNATGVVARVLELTGVGELLRPPVDGAATATSALDVTSVAGEDRGA
jgi:anti-sigma B factor antagonist